MREFIRGVLIGFLLGLVASSIICKKIFSKKEVLIQTKLKRDTLTIVRYDTIKQKLFKEIIKQETVRLYKDSIIIKPETTYQVELRKYYYKDSILSLSFLANYVDTASFEYKLKLKRNKEVFNNIFTYLYNPNYHTFIYSRRVFFRLYTSVGFTSDNNNKSVSIGLSLVF